MLVQVAVLAEIQEEARIRWVGTGNWEVTHRQVEMEGEVNQAYQAYRAYLASEACLVHLAWVRLVVGRA